MESRFTYGKIFLLSFGFLGGSVIWGVYNAFVPIFLFQKFGLAPAMIGFFMSLDNIAALFIQPAVGAWSDRLRTPLGRRLPFILVGAPISALAFGFIPLAAVLPLFVACTSTLLLSAALWRTPAVALMPDVTPSAYRSQANGIINFMGGIGAILAYVIGGMLYKLNPSFPFWLGSVLVLLSALILFFFIKEPTEYEHSEEQPSVFASLRSELKSEDKSALRLFLAILFWFIGYSALESFFTLYAQNYLGINAGDGATLLSTFIVFFVLFAIPSGWIAAKIGRRITITMGLVMVMLAMLFLYLFPPDVLLTGLGALPVVGIPLVEGGAPMLTIAGLLLIFGGIGWAFVNINSLPMVVDLTGAARVGTYTGLYYLFSTLAAIVGPNVNGWAIKLSGDNYNIIMLIAPFFMFVAMLLMLGVKRGEAQIIQG